MSHHDCVITYRCGHTAESSISPNSKAYRTDSPNLCPKCANNCCQRNKYAGNWDERAGGVLHCPDCGKAIAKFRQ